MSLVVHTDFAAELEVIVPVLSGKVFPLFIGATEDFPALSYTFRDGDRESFYRDSFGLEVYTVSLDIYSNSYITNQEIYDAIVTKFNGQTVVLNSNTVVQRAIIASTLNSIDSADSTIYRTILEMELTV